MKKAVVFAAILCFLFACQEKKDPEVKAVVNENYREYSSKHPGDFPVEETPQFVVIGADDCAEPEAMGWIVDFLAKHKNPDGTPIHMNFYLNGCYAEVAGAAWKKAYEAGHEIGNHTYSHFIDEKGVPIDARLLGDSIWLAEILKNDTIVSETIGMPISEIVGFRTPRLEYNEAAFRMMAKRGFLYDCSIEEGGEEGQDGTNRFWPYTLDNGSMPDSLMVLWSTGDASWGYQPAGKTPGLWEIPVYNYVVPHDSLSEKYGFEKGLWDRIVTNMPYFDTIRGNLTGFDYNVFAPVDWTGAAMKGNELLATLKNTFDLHYSGNRAPFTFGLHPDFYVEKTDEYYGSAGNWQERRAVVEEFLLYLLANEDVRIVTGAELIEWMKNPQPLN